MSALGQGLPFSFDVSDGFFFEKSEAGDGKHRRVAGVCSVETKDQEDETLYQKGLDFDYFLTKGFYNDNHDRSIHGVIGYPENALYFAKGAQLPNGKPAKANCTWTEGYLLPDDPRADSVWRKGLALQGTPRALGFSVEGKRLQVHGGLVLKALVRNIAITHMPVHDGTRADLFLKSLVAAQEASPAVLERAWAAFEYELQGSLRKKPIRSTITKAQAVDEVLRRHPSLTTEHARRAVELILARKRRTS